jgi:CubicO group peptidase (beta-lactamase class C family)
LFAADMRNDHRLGCRRLLFKLFGGLAALGISFHPVMAVEDEQDELTVKLESIRRDHGLPALAAAAFRNGKLVANVATGVRELGAPERVTTDDHWHLGSCTKSMTATLAGMLVDEGKLSWSSTISEIFPEMEGKMRPAWRPVTLEQLLTHRSGAPEHPSVEVWAEALQRKDTPTEQRLAILRGTICEPPEEPRGKKFIYSNEGYAIAGAMIERVTGCAWEDLLRQRLFEPLGMKSAGFGEPASPGKVDQPWGHIGQLGELRPVPPGPMADNPPAIGPAATVHASLADFARYASWHADWEHAEPRLLSEETFAKLHKRAPGQDYAMGWLVQDRDWAGGDVLWHTGSNAMFYAVMWVAPEKETAFVAATNAAHEEADDACNEAVIALIRQILKKY